ncbi:hypothetical protein MBRA1_003731 [Malassezia brasiliensis]|uniref:Chitin synthesis regulation, Congo red resistance, RCR protein n=1 Tax=Malassezia brasiliensis TaxID=1821822 RepID=A0AAF0IRG4_9BASI|nr:hypothetical protein MBRA1_003731 [Malassezia brasiliensis]
MSYYRSCDYYGNCSGLSPGARAGIGIGVSVFVIIVVFTIGTFIARRRRSFTPYIRPGYNTGYMGAPPQQPMQPAFNNFGQPYNQGGYPAQGGYQPPSGPPPWGGYQPPSGPPPSTGNQTTASTGTGTYAPPVEPPPSYQPSKN